MFKKKPTQKPLINWTLLSPTLLFISLIFAIFFSFNTISHRFLISESQKAIQSKVDVLNRLYVGEYIENEEQNLFETNYLIVDEMMSIVYSSTDSDKIFYKINCKNKCNFL